MSYKMNLYMTKNSKLYYTEGDFVFRI